MYAILPKSTISCLFNLLLENLAIFYIVHISNLIQTSLSLKRYQRVVTAPNFTAFTW